MSIKGILLQPVVEKCPYIDGLIAVNENFIVKELEEEDQEALLSFGYRHFGEVFFRPLCKHCLCCISIRIPVQQYKPSKSDRRLFHRNRNLTVDLTDPIPGKDAFALYNKHKRRFKRQVSESYKQYIDSLYHPFPFNKMLTIKEGERLVAVSHLDVTANAISAVYCYYDPIKDAHYSPGKFAILKEIEMAKQMGMKWLYLGYFIPQNRHTNYKILYKPNQLLTEESQWVDYLDADGNVVNPFPLPYITFLEKEGETPEEDQPLILT